MQWPSDQLISFIKRNYLKFFVFIFLALKYNSLQGSTIEIKSKVLSLEKDRYSQIISVGIKNQTEKIKIKEGSILSCLEKSLKKNSNVLLVLDSKTQAVNSCQVIK